MVNPAIRRAGATDVDALLDLMHAFHAEAGFALDRARNGAALRAIVADESIGAIWIAEAGGVAAGHAVLTTRFTMEHTGWSGYVDDLYVAPAFRRRGVARGLLDALVAECRQRGCAALQVEVGRDNVAALAAYAAFGLRIVDDGRVLAVASLD